MQGNLYLSDPQLAHLILILRYFSLQLYKRRSYLGAKQDSDDKLNSLSFNKLILWTLAIIIQAAFYNEIQHTIKVGASESGLQNVGWPKGSSGEM